MLKLNKEDFVLNHIEDEDYWFDIHGESHEELSHKYSDHGMIGVTQAVYSFKDKQWGIKRKFLWNWDVITPHDEPLRKIIEEVAIEQRGKHE
jgi:hypothetical protein